MNRKDLKALALMRLREAKVLLANGESSGAYYLAGYVVECSLKACIAKQTRIHDFPDKNRVDASWKHEPEPLVRAAGLQPSLDAESKADPRFRANWDVVKDWRANSRYFVWDEKKAEDMVGAVSDNKHGVLRWLKRHW